MIEIKLVSCHVVEMWEKHLVSWGSNKLTAANKEAAVVYVMIHCGIF